MVEHVTILLFAIIFILFVYIGVPVGNQEIDDFFVPRIIGNVNGHIITAPPLAIGPPVAATRVQKGETQYSRSGFISQETKNIVSDSIDTKSNGYHIYEGSPVSGIIKYAPLDYPIPLGTSGYVDPSDPPPLPGIKIRDANGIPVIEGTPDITLPPGMPPVVYGISLK
jgi:hypothetical protein